MTAKDLKNALLQEAVQGKLVPQIASEGNARDLLEEIRKSHTDLQIPTESAGKKKSDLRSKSQIRVTKKGKPLPEITEDEIPFDIPESWCWCRLDLLCELIEDCPHTTMKDEGKGFPLIRTPNVGEGRLILDNVHRVSEENYKKRNIRATPKEKDLIFAREAPAGNVAVIQKNQIVCLGQRTVLIRPIEKLLDSNFLAFYILSPDTQKNLIKKATGTTVAHVNMADIRPYIIPLPPLAEQKRIVAALEKLLPLIEEYGKKETALRQLNTQIGVLTKKAVLQEAVQGKLVPQIASEGNARDLLEKIRKEKLSHGLDFANAKSGKRNKKETALAGSNPCDISEDEIPFDIPESWCWCRLGELIELTSGQDISTDTFSDMNDGIPYVIGASNFSNGNIVVNRWTKAPKTFAYKNDLLLTCKGTVGEMAFLSEERAHIARQVMALRIKEYICKKYIRYYLATQIESIKSKAKSMIPGISRDDVLNLLFPLPPLSEQKRIVAALEKFMPLCERFGKEC